MKTISDTKVQSLEKKAKAIRQDLINMLVEAGSGHSAGPLGMADIFTTLYFHTLRHDPKKPNDPNRDRLFLSNGHIAPVWYATLAHAGYLPKKEMLTTLRKLGTRLQGHPHKKGLPPIENPAGPLGQGISQAVGYALAAQMDGKKFETYCLMGDGELDEGQCWEAFMFAGNNKLHNLTVIIDRNNIQIDGDTEDVMPLASLRDKFEAFKFHVIDIDGHNMRDISDACNQARAIYEKPVCILAHTIPGKGVGYMEFDYTWHGKPPKPGREQDLALCDLRTLGGALCSEHE